MLNTTIPLTIDDEDYAATRQEFVLAEHQVSHTHARLVRSLCLLNTRCCVCVFLCVYLNC